MRKQRVRAGVVDPGLHSRFVPDFTRRSARFNAATTGADSIWAVDHLIGLFPQSIWSPANVGGSRIAPASDAYYEPWTLLGYSAAKNRWPRLRLGVGVTDTGRRNPAVTAQAAATLHLLTGGRAILGIGPGERENNEPYGVEWKRPVARFEEAVATIRALWASNGEPISRDSEFFPLRDAVFALPPYRGTRPELWMGAHGPRMLRIAGQYADGWLPAFTGSPSEYRANLDKVRSAATNAGRDPDAIEAGTWFFVIAAKSAGIVEEILNSPVVRAYGLVAPAEAWARHGAEHPLGPTFAGGQDILPQTIDEATALEYGRRAPMSLLREFFLAGTPSEILDQLAERRDHGLTYAVLADFGLAHPRLSAGLAASTSFAKVVRGVRRL
ncbi:LLM class flavin-dependent oxidoreductase [Nocardia camponoti]|uniref:Phthiodiolone/phenolphthiodiolone dimycocerosates ketoreductase n=1 Tax=Nocardia camponoti TaxID=1616106 RepID=A0A917V318_9NOCA|nr:LLM class flavin-dependent oxidoreductase [Nocardia camponoti]GGK32668.1 phthiodiolone/phenolphthiodiolone dimycocerosates ketoreductase [Nocardia camponoti]